ncbi:MAG TPA: mucoidy inhibitor MuiA family protein [Anaeromyxobacteraceae bacterium]|nr:mucoidy inhibitor MuiA family protein [Anaeromyxobacteraceae bacterium]
MRPLTALVLALLLPTASLAAVDVKAVSRADAVTVYRTSARVSRIARADLPAGDVRLLIEGLPVGLADDSVRVEGQGAGKGKIWGVSVEPVTKAEAMDAAAREAEERVEKLQLEDRALEDQAKVADSRRKFVESLRSTYSEERAKNLAVRGVTAREWADLAGFVDAQLTATAEQIRKVDAARREVARRLAAARAELEKLRAKRSETTKTIAVELTTERAGGFELAVSYLVGAASWEPVWDARLDPDKEAMELSLRAEITQRSGEDWKDVKLAVSTAEPGRGLFVPALESRWLTGAPPPQPVYRAKSARGMAAPAPAMARSAPARAMEEEAPEPQAFELEAPEASAEQGLLAATFTTPRRETVDGSGRARSVALSRFPLKAKVARVTAPRVESAVFLTAKAVNETGLPLLSGQAGVYVGDEFVGRAPLPATPPGGELELAFGADGRVEVERRVLERKHETSGVVSKDEVFRYRTRVTLKNRYATPIDVRLLDLVPVSREEKIQVKLLDGTTAATREDPERPGVKTWELKLAAREERAIELRYEVRYPRGFPIQGLE